MSVTPDSVTNAAAAEAVRRFIPGSPERSAFYKRIRAFTHFACRFIYAVDVEGMEHIPAAGPVIIASNHLSFWDIPSLATTPRRHFHFMAKAEYAENSFVRWFFTNLEAFFVRRGEGDMQAIRDALAVLKAGQVLAIYPEGHRSDDHALIRAHEGLALIAFKSGAPVVPVATWGSEGVGKGWHVAFGRPTIHVRFGAPIAFVPAGKRATKEELIAGTEQVMTAIAGMLPPPYRGVYAAQAASAAATSIPTAGQSER